MLASIYTAPIALYFLLILKSMFAFHPVIIMTITCHDIHCGTHTDTRFSCYITLVGNLYYAFMILTVAKYLLCNDYPRHIQTYD